MYEIMYPYPEENTIQKLINDFNLKVVGSEYLEKVKLNVACPTPNTKLFEKSIRGMEHLQIHFETKQEDYIRV